VLNESLQTLVIVPVILLVSRPRAVSSLEIISVQILAICSVRWIYSSYSSLKQSAHVATPKLESPRTHVGTIRRIFKTIWCPDALIYYYMSHLAPYQSTPRSCLFLQASSPSAMNGFGPDMYTHTELAIPFALEPSLFSSSSNISSSVLSTDNLSRPFPVRCILTSNPGVQLSEVSQHS
jgi:hypothetical protein